ncbi:MAG: hypothetical protein M3Y87_26555 [Myxococcota bacterium]|nr:hypothetical protein [Myxococcota bacterium]
MKRSAIILLLLIGCDVEASLGSHDAATDAPSAMCHAHADAGVCVTCEASMCCDAFAACAAAATCPCIVECVLTDHTLDECIRHCGGADHGEHAPLIECARTECAGAC